MDDELKGLMKALGKVINETLTESADIHVAIQSIRDAGYEVFLIIEASIGFNKQTRGESGSSLPLEADEKGKGILRITPNDAKFLKSLKISIENDS